jgi:hypothetical protein
MAIVAVLVIDLVTIALGWLIVWGCVASWPASEQTRMPEHTDP